MNWCCFAVCSCRFQKKEKEQKKRHFSGITDVLRSHITSHHQGIRFYTITSHHLHHKNNYATYLSFYDWIFFFHLVFGTIKTILQLHRDCVFCSWIYLAGAWEIEAARGKRERQQQINRVPNIRAAHTLHVNARKRKFSFFYN